MHGKWNPLASPPEGATAEEAFRWTSEDIATFQTSRPDLPQGDYLSLTKRNQNLLGMEYLKAKDAARRPKAPKKKPRR